VPITVIGRLGDPEAEPPSSSVLTQSLGSGKLYVNGNADAGSALNKKICPSRPS